MVATIVIFSGLFITPKKATLVCGFRTEKRNCFGFKPTNIFRVPKIHFTQISCKKIINYLKCDLILNKEAANREDVRNLWSISYESGLDFDCFVSIHIYRH